LSRKPAGRVPASLPQGELWAAWSHLSELETRVCDAIGDGLAAELLVLWAIARFGGHGQLGDPVLQELVDEEMHPRFGDWVMEDIARFAFALGAGWSGTGGVDPGARMHSKTA
jgi:hypothetical protein